MQRRIPAATPLAFLFALSLLFASCSSDMLSQRHYGAGMYVKAERHKQAEQTAGNTPSQPRRNDEIAALPQHKSNHNLTQATPQAAPNRYTVARRVKEAVTKPFASNRANQPMPVRREKVNQPIVTNAVYTQPAAPPDASGSLILMIVGIVFIVLGVVFFVLGSWVLGLILGLVGLVFFLLSLLL
jgi:hypothetical protein